MDLISLNTRRGPLVLNAATMSNVTNIQSSDEVVVTGFVDRRQSSNKERGIERRQFGNSYRDLSEQGRELAEAIDAYKVQHRRRYITTDEMLQVIQDLGYRQHP
jgi:hypothetical protein